MNNHLIIYTDGSVYPNPDGIGGWGFVCPDYDEGNPYEYYGGHSKTTNNRMELSAAINALGIVPRGHFVTIVTDSQYVQRCMARRIWPESKPNADLGRVLEDAKRGRLIEVQMVAGHSGDKWNERAHELANKGRLEQVEYEKQRKIEMEQIEREEREGTRLRRTQQELRPRGFSEPATPTNTRSSRINDFIRTTALSRSPYAGMYWGTTAAINTNTPIETVTAEPEF